MGESSDSGNDLPTIDEMLASEVAELPDLPSIEESIADLGEMLNEQFEIQHNATAGNVEDLEPVDHFIVAALVRSHALIRGFVAMVEMRNKLCALPMIRFQLDSAMRLFAGTIADRSRTDLHYEAHILEGGKPSKFKDDSGRDLTDALLHRELSKRYPEVSRIYEDTSGYVHLSNRHLISVLDTSKMTTENVVFSDIHSLPTWSEREVRGALVEFVWATSCLLDLCRSWQRWKQNREQEAE